MVELKYYTDNSITSTSSDEEEIFKCKSYLFNTSVIVVRMSSSEDMITQLKSSVYNLLNTVGNNEVSLDQMNQYKSILDDFLKFGGSKDDIIVKIGETFFNYFLKGGLNDRSTQGPSDDEVVEGSKLIQFDYLENFMKDSFLEVGVPDKEASICAQVLMDADKRGIDSHGIGRLKV